MSNFISELRNRPDLKIIDKVTCPAIPFQIEWPEEIQKNLKFKIGHLCTSVNMHEMENTLVLELTHLEIEDSVLSIKALAEKLPHIKSPVFDITSYTFTGVQMCTTNLEFEKSWVSYKQNLFDGEARREVNQRCA